MWLLLKGNSPYLRCSMEGRNAFFRSEICASAGEYFLEKARSMLAHFREVAIGAEAQDFNFSGALSSMDKSSSFSLEGKREYCGAFGVYSFSKSSVAQDIYLGCMNLQHRGQDSAGMATFDGEKITLTRELGLVENVFAPKNMGRHAGGFVGIGHTRYPTIGAGGKKDAQPFLVRGINSGLALAHNGNIANYGRVKAQLEREGVLLSSKCDAELILKVFAREYKKCKDYFEAAKSTMQVLDGSYSVVLISGRGELVAFRDPHAIRPLCIGRDREKIVFASESVALDINNVPLVGDVKPGEVYVVDGSGVQSRVVLDKGRKHCMFEYVYFSRPDSTIDGRLVHGARVEMGRRLARIARVKADIVVGVPDTGRSAAFGYSRESGIPFEEGLIKNRYVGRTFIMPSQEKRQDAVKIKLNAVRGILEGKSVVLIDDSIVRGTTSGPLVKLVRDAGAREVHVRITCPPVIAPCFYGVDLPTYRELIAANRSVEEIRRFIGADSLAYLGVEDLVESIGVGKENLCLGCITDKYPTAFGDEIAQRMKKNGRKEGVRIWEEEA